MFLGEKTECTFVIYNKTRKLFPLHLISPLKSRFTFYYIKKQIIKINKNVNFVNIMILLYVYELWMVQNY
jgi:hypothetical protein